MSPLTRTRTVLATAFTLFALLALLAVGCSKKRGTPFDADAGHPDDWIPNHGAAYHTTGGCQDCHGKDLLGGIAAVSCSTPAIDGQRCHAGGPGGHPGGWLEVHSVTDPAEAPFCAQCHDNPANTLPPNCFNNSLCHGSKSGHPANWQRTHSLTNPSLAATCARCHDNPANALPANCFNNSLCHGPKSNHPAGWIDTHTRTDPSQAPVCAGCHDNQSNTLPPDCFNNSLCHGAQGNHPAGWDAPSQHGASAKAPNGFASCQPCHGSGFSGGGSGQSCFPCHGWNAPHARSTWIGGGSAHTTTSQTNAGICRPCHPGDPGTPGCFNNTLCHGPQTNHPAGWSAANQHGAAAMGAPGTMRGFASCQACHGGNFQGGTSGRSCFGCHGVNAPHRNSWEGRHDNTNQANAPACVQCHHENPGTPNCFNNTLCHGNQD